MPRMRFHLLTPLVVLAASLPAFAQDVLVVVPDELKIAAHPWRQHREIQGHRIIFREPGADVGATVKEAYEKSGQKLKFVMIVGDVEHVPCAVVNRKASGQAAALDPDPTIATDAPYADLDGDGLPDLAIGRVPADTVEEARQYLLRVIDYELSQDHGVWQSKLNVVAGTGGFGPMVDMMIEGLTKTLLAQAVPTSVEVSMTYASPLSPFCPPPAKFADYTVKRWSEGALVVAYVGHGSERSVDTVNVGSSRYPILGPAEVARIAAEHGAPVSVFVACSTGHFDGARDCLAEDLLKRPKGPVAVIASSRVSSPYSNGVMAREVLAALYANPAATTGELLTALKRRLADPAPEDKLRKMIENFGEMYEKDAAQRRVDRIDHVNLYNLLGDPCLRIARPAALTVLAGDAAAPGAKLRVIAKAPFDGAATVILERRRDASFRPAIALKTTDEDFRAVYEAANSRVVARAELPVKSGDFATEIGVPGDLAPGRYTVRVHLAGRSGSAAGAAEVTIAAKETK